MDKVKELLGDKWKDEMTKEELIEALEGMKLVDLSTGDYVNKEKFEKAVAKQKEAEEKATTLESSSFELKKQFDEMKPKYDAYVQKEHYAEIEGKAKAVKIRPECIKFAIHEVGEDGDFGEWAKNNPQYVVQEQQPKVVDSGADIKPSNTENDMDTFRKMY